MQNIKVGYIPVGQGVKINTRTLNLNELIKNNKIGLIIGGISIALLSAYIVLFINFINLIKILS